MGVRREFRGEEEEEGKKSERGAIERREEGDNFGGNVKGELCLSR